MDYLLVIAFLVGLLLFVFGWLRVLFAGFRHHPMTGIVALFPVLNVLILPSIWHRVYTSASAGMIGFLMAAISWFAGAGQPLQQYAKDAGFNLPLFGQGQTELALTAQPAERQILELPMPKPGSTPAPAASVVDADHPALPLPSGKEIPKSALYTMTYKPVAVNELRHYQGQYVRIIQQNRRALEGKLLGLDEQELALERRTNGGILAHKVKLVDIASSEVMIRE